MFYSQFILAKKGPLGTIWIAAHLERKLRKNQVADTDIGVSVDSILFPDVPIALRLSSHLLLGVVRIYSRKVNYLFDDCSEALLKIKQAFRSTAVDLPPEESTAPYHSITLPETFDLDDFELPDNEMFQGNYVDHHISTREQITLQESMGGTVYSTSQFGLDERFGDADVSQIGLDLDEDLLLDKAAGPGYDGVPLSTDVQAFVQPTTPLKNDEINEGTTEISDTILDDCNRIQMPGLAGTTDLIECAHAPATPGLVEEPVLTNVQEPLGFDDNMISVEHNKAEFTVEESVENALSYSDHHLENRGAINLSTYSGMNLDVLNTPTDGNCCNSGQLENGQSMSQEGTPYLVEMTKNLSLSLQRADAANHTKSSTPGLSCLDSAEILQDGRPSNSEVNVQYANIQDGPKSSSGGILQSVTEESGVARTSSDEPGVAELAKSEGQARDEGKDSMTVNTAVSEEMLSPCMHILQPCSLLPKESNTTDQAAELSDLPAEANLRCLYETAEKELTSSALPEVQGDGFLPIIGVLQVSEASPLPETASREDNLTGCCKLDELPGSSLPGDVQLQNLDESVNSDLPAPEKLLSVPEGPKDVVDNILLESSPIRKDPVEDERVGAGQNSIIGKKRSFTESTLALENSLSEESLELRPSKRSADFIPDDNDLLSTILVGRRSSVLKMKPTSPREVAPMKRLRPGPRVGASKRKVLMDDSMILHGDTIRQQLTSTEDIRRVRKKAPCTRPEIWMIQKQFLDVDILSEPIFTGMSMQLHFLHAHVYDLTGVKVSQVEETNAYVEAAKVMNVSHVSEESEVDKNPEVSTIHKEVADAATSLHNENKQCEDHSAETHDLVNACGDAPQLKTSENENISELPETEIERSSIEALNATDGVVTAADELPTLTIPCEGDDYHMVADSEVQSIKAGVTCGTDTLQVDGLCLLRNRSLDEQFINVDVPIADKNGNAVSVNCTELITRGEHLLENGDCKRVQDVGYVNDNCCASLGDFSSSLVTLPKGTGELNCPNDSLHENGKDELGLVSENMLPDGSMDCDYKNQELMNINAEEPELDAINFVGIEVDIKKATSHDEEKPGCLESEPQESMDVETISFGPPTVDDQVGFDNVILQHDTEFLNVDDDAAAEEDANEMPSAENVEFLESSGWSSRTRAVAKYLRIVFDREAVNGKMELPVENLLVGKTRKEASRMFFETLVLKTRDYVHVEQSRPFGNINIMPQMKLMKSDF